MTMRQVCEYFIARSIGRVLRARDGSSVNVEVEARRGAVALKDARVDVEAIARAMPMRDVEVISGTIEVIRAQIPWNAFGREAVVVEAEEVSIVARLSPSFAEDVGAEEDEGERARSTGRAVLSKALDVLFRGAKARVRGISVVVQDSDGAEKFMLRVDVAAYTHGEGATFEGISVRHITTGFGCSVPDIVVVNARATVRVKKDSTSRRIDVEFGELEATATVHALSSLAEIARAYKAVSTERMHGSTGSRPRRSFIDDVLSHDEATEALEKSVFHDAESDIAFMGESLYEDSSDEFFDCNDAIRELSKSMQIEPDSPRAKTIVLVSCPKCTLHAPFDDVRCSFSATSVEVDIADTLEISYNGLDGVFAVNEANELSLHVQDGRDGTRCRVAVHDDHATLTFSQASARLNGIECLSTSNDSGTVLGSIYWLDDSTHPLDGSLPLRCLNYVKGTDATDGAAGASLREQLANDASWCVKLRLPTLNMTLNAAVLDTISFIFESMYELPENHPLAMRVVTPDSVLNPVVLALSVDRVVVQLDQPPDVGNVHASTASATTVNGTLSPKIVCTFNKLVSFAAGGVSGAVGADFLWTQCASATVAADDSDIADVSTGATLSFARVSGEAACMDASVAGAAVSVGECEALIQRLNTFIPAREDEVNFDAAQLRVALRLCDSSLVYNSNGSFAIAHSDVARIYISSGLENGDFLAPQIEVTMGDVTGYIAPQDEARYSGDIRKLRAYPFTAQNLRNARFAQIFIASALSLKTVTAKSRTAIASIRLKSCRVDLHKDTIHALQRLLASNFDVLNEARNASLSGDDDDYVFISTAPRSKDVARAGYASDVTENDIENAMRDDEGLFPRQRARGRPISVTTPSTRAPLLKRDVNAPSSPNVIENFFYRADRRVRKRRPPPIFASGSVTAVRQRSSRLVVVRTDKSKKTRKARFSGEFPNTVAMSVPVVLPALEESPPSNSQARYLSLPKDAVVPRSTVHVDAESFDIRVLAGLFWSPTFSNTAEHADSVSVDALGSCIGIRVAVKTITTRIDHFPANSGTAAHRIACSVKDISCEDITPGATWPNVVHYDASFGQRLSVDDLLSFDLTGVRPDANESTDVEYVIQASCLPLHVKLDQRVLRLLMAVFEDSEDISNVVFAPADDSTYFQKIEIDKLSFRFDYCGRQVDIEALRSGNLLEALNLIPWDGVRLDIQSVRLIGLLGVGSAAERVCQTWFEDISRTQAHKFITGVTPIKSAANIGRGAIGLVAKPLEYYYRHKRGGVVGGLAIGIGALLKAVSLEAMKLGAFAAAHTSALLAAAECVIRADASNQDPGGPEPTTAFEGLSIASRDVWRGTKRATKAVVLDPCRDYSSGASTAKAAALSALKATPFATVTGAKGVSQAFEHALTGAKNAWRDPPRPPADVQIARRRFVESAAESAAESAQSHIP